MNRNAKAGNAEAVVIDMEAFKTAPEQSKPAQFLVSTGNWLNDDIINQWQRLLKKEFSHVNGLQDVLLVHNMGFTVETGEFVQVLYVDCHWVTISTIGCGPAEVDIFDSGTCTPMSKLNPLLEQQIAAILCTQHNAITVRLVSN